MKYFEKYFMMTEEHKPLNQEEAPLAFMTPLENNDAFEKRKRTVENWARPYYTPDEHKKVPVEHIIENKPLSGYSVIDTATRYRTNNKLFRVQHPIGFVVEISAENLFDLISNTNMRKGVIEEELLWMRDGAQNRLVLASDVDIETHLDPTNTKNIQPGDMVNLSKIKKLLYIGVQDINVWYEKTVPDKITFHQEYFLRKGVINKKHVFINIDTMQFHTYKTMPKYTIIKRAVADPVDYLNKLIFIKDTYTWYTGETDDFNDYGVCHVYALGERGRDIIASFNDIEEYDNNRSDHMKGRKVSF